MIPSRVVPRASLLALVVCLLTPLSGCQPDSREVMGVRQLNEVKWNPPWRSFKLRGVVLNTGTQTPDGFKFRRAESHDDTATSVRVVYDGLIPGSLTPQEFVGREVIVQGTWDGVFRGQGMIMRESGPYSPPDAAP